MKINKRVVRVALIGAATVGVSLPLLNQMKNTRALGQTDRAPVSAAPIQAPKVASGSPFPKVDPAKVVITVGDEKVTAGEFSSFFSELDPGVQAQVLARPEAKRQLVDRFVDMKLLANEAKRLKLDQSTKVRTMYEQLLANAAMLHISEEKDANQKFFNDNKNWFEELQVRHILIGVQGGPVSGATLTDAQALAKAQDLKKKLDHGEDFATLARANSDDKGSAAVGGSLGPAPMVRGQMVPKFEEAAFALKKGDISDPVKTRFGYHIIQVLNRTIPSFSDATTQQRVASRRAEMLLEQLKKDSKTEIDDSYFGAPLTKSTAAATPAAAHQPKAEARAGK